MKKSLVLAAALLVVVGTGFAQNVPETNPNTHHFTPRGWARPGGGGGSNLVYHNGGKVLVNAKVVDIFWGPSFTTTDASYASSLQAYRDNFGTTGEYNVITQYYQTVGGVTSHIQTGSLKGSQADWFDTSTPPTNVTDATVQAEVNRYIAANGYDASTIYEVFIPSGSYSSDGSSTSCGGPSLAYCAYHGHFNNSVNGADTKYSIQPWAGCSGCSSFSNPLYDQEHFVCHETREAVTDEDLNAWYDRRGNEADDKCAWSPVPFLDGGNAYQYEWSNAAGGCVQKQ